MRMPVWGRITSGDGLCLSSYIVSSDRREQVAERYISPRGPRVYVLYITVRVRDVLIGRKQRGFPTRLHMHAVQVLYRCLPVVSESCANNSEEDPRWCIPPAGGTQHVQRSRMHAYPRTQDPDNTEASSRCFLGASCAQFPSRSDTPEDVAAGYRGLPGSGAKPTSESMSRLHRGRRAK